jgi:hypothetical protein
MTTAPVITGKLREQLRPGAEVIGGFFQMCALTGRALLQPFEWREFMANGTATPIRSGTARHRGRCDQPVDPGHVIPAPSINSGLNPAPADRVAGTPPPMSDPLQRALWNAMGNNPIPASTFPTGLPRPSTVRRAVN